MDKKLLNQTLQKLFSGGSGDEERHVLQSQLPYWVEDINNKSIHDLQLSKKWVSSVIICDKPNFDVKS